MTDYSELKRLAEAATQGDWTHLKHGVIKGGPAVQFTNGSSQQQIVMTTGAEWMRPGEQYSNADFIAAANPSSVLALIAENERLKARDSLHVQQFNQLSEFRRRTVEGFNLQIEQLNAENEALRKDAERLDWLTAQGEIEEPGQGDVRGFVDKAMGKESPSA